MLLVKSPESESEKVGGGGFEVEIEHSICIAFSEDQDLAEWDLYILLIIGYILKMYHEWNTKTFD